MLNEGQRQEALRRLSRLEGRNRRLKLVLVALVVPLVGLGTIAAYRPRVVTANEFVLKDEQGRCRARLGFSRPWEGPQFGLYDAKGVLRVRLTQARDGRACLAAHDESGAERARLGYQPGRDWPSWAELYLHDAWRGWEDEDEGTWGSVYVCADPDEGGGWLETCDSEGRTSWAAP